MRCNIEEEKKAIQLLKSYAGMTHKLTDNQGRPKLDQAIERALNLIEKQNNRLEQLEKENEFWKEYKEKLDKLDTEDFIFKHELENYIPKSVIKKKIEELEKQDTMTLYGNYIRDGKKSVLKELLGGSNEE